MREPQTCLDSSLPPDVTFWFGTYQRQPHRSLCVQHPLALEVAYPKLLGPPSAQWSTLRSTYPVLLLVIDGPCSFIPHMRIGFGIYLPSGPCTRHQCLCSLTPSSFYHCMPSTSTTLLPRLCTYKHTLPTSFPLECAFRPSNLCPQARTSTSSCRTMRPTPRQPIDYKQVYRLFNPSQN
jgi:hypothetical protein